MESGRVQWSPPESGGVRRSPQESGGEGKLLIYGQKNFAVNSAAVERVLAGKSLVPTNVSNPQNLDPTVVHQN